MHVWNPSHTNPALTNAYALPLGKISNEVFALLCRLETFDLSANSIDRSTLMGYLACNRKNLKDATKIHASDQGLKGARVKMSSRNLFGTVPLFWTTTLLCN